MTPVRVLWLIKGLGLGGAERLLVSLASTIDRDRFSVDVAHLLPSTEGLDAELADLDVSTIDLGARRTVEVGWPLRLRQMIRTEGYPLVHTHSPVPAVAARLLAPRTSTVLHTEHNLWSGYRQPTRIANAATYPRNAHVVAVSDAVRSTIRCPAWLPQARMPPVETLHHGIDVARFPTGVAARERARALLALEDDHLAVGCVASLTPQKDHLGLVDAFDRVRVQVPAARLLLIGSGPEERSLRAEVVRRGLSSHVRFLGARQDIADLLPGLDLSVLASRYEGLPVSVLEAMACGVACVVTQVGGSPEIIVDGRDGLLVPPGRPDRLAHAVVRLLQDPAARRRLADSGQRRVLEGFTIERAARRLETIYGALLAGGRLGT